MRLFFLCVCSYLLCLFDIVFGGDRRSDHLFRFVLRSFVCFETVLFVWWWLVFRVLYCPE